MTYINLKTKSYTKTFIDLVTTVEIDSPLITDYFKPTPDGMYLKYGDGECHFEAIIPPTQEELDAIALAQAEVRFISMTDSHIQAEVDKYNVANGVLFSSIHNCTTYKDVASYPHQAFCQNIIQWNADVWETVRAYQLTLTSIPTDEEFQAVLDGVIFNG